MKRIPVFLEESQHEAIRKLSFDTRLSISEHIRKAVEEYLKKQKAGS